MTDTPPPPGPADTPHRKQIRLYIIIAILTIPPLLGLVILMIQKSMRGMPEAVMTPVTTLPAAAPPPADPVPAAAVVETGGKQLTSAIKNSRVNISHILIAYRGAADAPDTIKLERDEAFNVALQIRDRLNEDPAAFEAIAREYSDDRSTAMRGGLIPPFNLNDVAPAFREAIAGLASGQISDVVETPFGFHLIRREDITEAIIQSILIPYQGALHASSAVTRTEHEAEKLADEIHARITAGTASFSDMAITYSQDPWAARGGYMQGLVTPQSIPHREIVDTVFGLQEGEVSRVLRTPLGCQIFKRCPIEYRQACHVVVLIGNHGRDEADKKIRRAYQALQRNVPFPEVVQTFSEEEDKARTEGFTPVIYRGTWIYELEEVLFGLKIGEISEPIELKDAFVILARVR